MFTMVGHGLISLDLGDLFIVELIVPFILRALLGDLVATTSAECTGLT